MEYIDFQLCLMLHCLPEQLDEMEQWKLGLYREFMQLEISSGRLRQYQLDRYGR